MDKQGIIDYVLHTPENINPAILGQMLDEFTGGGSMEPFIIEYDDLNSILMTEITVGEFRNIYLSGRPIILDSFDVEANEEDSYANNHNYGSIQYIYDNYTQDGPGECTGFMEIQFTNYKSLSATSDVSKEDYDEAILTI